MTKCSSDVPVAVEGWAFSDECLIGLLISKPVRTIVYNANLPTPLQRLWIANARYHIFCGVGDMVCYVPSGQVLEPAHSSVLLNVVCREELHQWVNAHSDDPHEVAEHFCVPVSMAEAYLQCSLNAH